MHQLATLCEILCDNEIPQDHMRILKLKTATAESATDDLADPLLDMEAVHVKRCLSKLRKLECFEMDNICQHQEQELRQVAAADAKLPASNSYCLEGMGCPSRDGAFDRDAYLRWYSTTLTIQQVRWLRHVISKDPVLASGWWWICWKRMSTSRRFQISRRCCLLSLNALFYLHVNSAHDQILPKR